MKIRSLLSCHEMTFTLLAALWFTAVGNGWFIWRAWQLIDYQRIVSYLFALSVPLVLFCAFTALFSLFALPWIRKPLLTLLLLGSAAANYFSVSYGTVIDTNMVQNVFETNCQEALALITPRYLLWMLLAGLLPAVLLCSLHIICQRPWWMGLALRLATALAALATILLIAAFFFKDYASLVRNNKPIVKLVTPANAISGVGHYVQDRWFSGSQALVRLGEDARTGPRIAAADKKTLVVLVLGETARAENFSLGGYGRNTNPKLARQDVIYFPRATSCGTETAVSVPCMFSGMTRSHYDATLARHREGLLDVMAHAGVSVLWRENDGGCKGACNRVPHTDMTQWQLPAPRCGTEGCLDEVLLNRLNHYLDGLDNNGVVVLHQMGSHGPAYYRRYPAGERPFTPTCDSHQIQLCDHQALVNTYDNSVRYTDSMLSDTLDLLKGHGDRFNIALIYLSDHGESLGEHGMYLHGAPWLFAPSQQTHIPFLMWLSPGWRQAMHVDGHCVSQRAAREAVSQDNLFHTLLGMLDVHTRIYQPQLDILAACRQS